MSAPGGAGGLDPIALLEGLVSIYSPSAREEQAVGYLVAEMGAAGLDAFRDEAGNAVGVAGAGPATIVLLGHIDTVAGFLPPRREGRKLHGRGTVDAKGPLAAFVAAAAQAAVPRGVRVVVVGAVEEECATSRGARHALHQYAPRACVIGEPSGWDRVTLGYKGRLLVRYFLARPMAHGAGRTRSACEAAVEFWQRLRAHADEQNRERPALFDQITPALEDIRSSGDGLRETVEAGISIRIPPAADLDALKAFLRSVSNGAELGFGGEEPAFRAEKNTPLVRAFLKAIRDQGGEPAFKRKTGTSDMNVVGPAWGCPILAYGPGDSALDHTPDEHLDLDEYLRAIAVLRAVIESLPEAPSR